MDDPIQKTVSSHNINLSYYAVKERPEASQGGNTRLYINRNRKDHGQPHIGNTLPLASVFRPSEFPFRLIFSLSYSNVNLICFLTERLTD